MGVVTNSETGHVPDLEFYIRTTLTMDQVRDAYKQAFAEKWESAALISLPINDVLGLINEKGDVHSDCALKIAPPTAASLILLKDWRK